MSSGGRSCWRSSRKDFVGALTQRRPRERLAGTLAAVAEGVDRGATILRVHDVAEVRDFLTVRAALRGEAKVPDDLQLRGVAEAPSAAMNGITIAQLSDLHCGSPHFVPSLLERAIEEVNELAPDVVIVSGDLTSDGFVQEYQTARDYLDRIECQSLIVIPGQPRLAQRRLRPLRGAVRRRARRS